MTELSDSSYAARLGAVLRRRDPEALHLFLRESAAGYGDDRQVSEVEQRSHAEMEELMHRMILARQDLAELHQASAGWLREHGQSAPAAGQGAGRPRRIRSQRQQKGM
jgi:hypothetical protein